MCVRAREFRPSDDSSFSSHRGSARPLVRWGVAGRISECMGACMGVNVGVHVHTDTGGAILRDYKRITATMKAARQSSPSQQSRSPALLHPPSPAALTAKKRTRDGEIRMGAGRDGLRALVSPEAAALPLPPSSARHKPGERRFCGPGQTRADPPFLSPSPFSLLPSKKLARKSLTVRQPLCNRQLKS